MFMFSEKMSLQFMSVALFGNRFANLISDTSLFGCGASLAICLQNQYYKSTIV